MGTAYPTTSIPSKQNSNPLVGSYTSLTPNATANLNDMWNRLISSYGAVVTTRNPAHQNTLGYDADILIVPNAANVVLGNSRVPPVSGSVHLPRTIYVAGSHYGYFTIHTYFFYFEIIHRSERRSIAPGDVLRYRVDYQNNGNDASTNTIIYDNIPTGATYLPGSLIINGASRTDAAADDQAEYDVGNNRVIFRLGTGADGSTGGGLAVGASGYITFDVYIASSCLLVTCNNTLSNSARIDYAGQLSTVLRFMIQVVY